MSTTTKRPILTKDSEAITLLAHVCAALVDYMEHVDQGDRSTNYRYQTARDMQRDVAALLKEEREGWRD